MKKIQKHEFEAVSLLTVDNGLLDLTVVPTVGRLDWVIPTSLILSVDSYDEHIWTYLWRNEEGVRQEVVVYQLIPNDITPDKIVVLEGNTDVHRIGLLTKGELSSMQARISDVKDIEQEENVSEQDSLNQMSPAQSFTQLSTQSASDDIKPYVLYDQTMNETDESASNTTEIDYVYQLVEIDGQKYVVPDLDTLAHHLVDLDS